MASFTLGTSSANPGTTLQIKATGSSTSWLQNTNFQFTGGTGATLTTQSVDAVNQIAWLSLYTGTASGTLTIFENVDGPSVNAAFTVNASPSFTLSCSSAPVNQTVTITATGLAENWTGGTTISLSGGTGASIVSGYTVNNTAVPQTIVFTLKTGTAAGTLTITESTNSTTAAFTVTTSNFTKYTRVPQVGLFIDQNGNLMVNSGNVGDATVSIPSAAGNVIVSANPGRLATVLVTTTGSGGPTLIYDNATTNSGTVIGYIPASAAVGTLYIFDMPAANGITVAGISSGPVLTVSYS